MRGKSRRYDFDLVLAGEFRGSGEVAETIASHLASLAACSLQLGLLWLRDPALPPSAPVHARIARLVREHTAVPIPPEIDDLTCRLVLVYEPRLLAAAASGIPRLRADHALVVLAEPLLRSGGPAFDAGARRRRDRGSHRQAPALVPGLPGDPQAVPGACRGPALRPRDLPPLEPIAAWRTERNRAAAAAQSWGACCASTTTGCRQAATPCSRPIRPSPISRCASSVARRRWPAWSSLCPRPGGSLLAKPSAPGASSPGSTSMSTIRTSRNASSRAAPSRPWRPAGS